MEIVIVAILVVGFWVGVVVAELQSKNGKRKRKRKNDELPDIPVPEIETFLKPADEVYVPKPAVMQTEQKPAPEQYGPYVEWARRHQWTSLSGISGFYDPNWIGDSAQYVANHKLPPQPPDATTTTMKQ